MSDTPADLKYTSSHEWVKLNEDGHFIVGITDHAQEALGDIVFVELPDPDTDLEAGDSCIVVESVKAASDVYCPVAGKVIAINEALEDAAELVNTSPYSDGWLMVIEPADAGSLEGLLDAEMYAAEIKEG
ncbi:MAG: glycine cleavage system protein GcvH [Gammaproteobacteria bacterium]